MRTNFVPGLEFDRVEVRFEDDTRFDVAADASTAWFDGVRVLRREGVPARSRFSVRLLLDDEVVIERRVQARVRRSAIVTVLLTRDCAGVVCPAAGDSPAAIACLGGVCVVEGCVTGAEPECPAPRCVEDLECSTAVGCADPACFGGACSEAPSARCGTAAVCDLRSGSCVPTRTSDGGLPDGGGPCALCDVNARCVSERCECDPGFVGDGMTCTARPPISQTDGYLKAHVPGPDDRFGTAVALNGDGTVLAVGAPQEDGSGRGIDPTVDEAAMDAGAVYLYRRSGDAWLFEAYVKAPNAGAGDRFGSSVALDASGDVLVVGAPNEDGVGAGVDPGFDDGGSDTGAVYVYRRSGGIWAFESLLKANNPGDADNFGFSLSLSADGNVLATGAFGESGSGRGVNPPSDEGAAASGAVYVFRRDVAWSFEAYLKPRDTAAFQEFGWAVALDAAGDVLVAGAPGEDGAGTTIDAPYAEGAPFSGAVFLFRRVGGTWTYETYFKAANATANDLFGQALALGAGGDLLFVGAPDEDGSGMGLSPPDDDASVGSGAAYVYQRVGGVWSQLHYLKAANPQPTGGDTYGAVLSASTDGTALIVGARNEDGSGLGVSPAADEAAMDAGACYLLRQVAGAWRAGEVTLKATNTGGGDAFGWSVATSRDGTTVAVGAALEDGGGSGVGPASDEAATDAGAVYVFR
ncbi:MAG: integrin [Sandaracinus sp.]|nr:integrin [Sandaracinus sp.]